MSDTAGRSSALTAEKRAQLAARIRSAASSTQLLAAEPIAVVGIGCRFPGGVDSPDRYWQLLANGVDAIREVPPERWDIQSLYDPDPATPGKMSTRYGSFLDGIDRFDNTFFGVAGREAAYMDPQQRLLLEVSWEALEHAGQSPEQLAGSTTGVFIGACLCDYATPQFMVPQSITAYTAAGSTMSILANRISYLLDLQGPSAVVDTACSSSLVAVHLACQSLRNRESNLALAGGVNLIIMPVGTIALSKSGMMAPDGRCKTFDSRADGYVRGEGCGVIVLKRLNDALEHNDRILAVIRGSAVNQDGKSSGLTAPNGQAQQAVIRRALEQARVLPEQVSYIEAHGTGTSLGDPIEVEALTAVVGQARSDGLPCYLGSVKTNIGHLEGAAGIAGLIKVVLSLAHKQLPPHLHFRQLNPNIMLEGTPFQIPTRLTAWEIGGASRIAGASGFGFGGTNAHVVLEEAPEPKPLASAERPFQLLTLSAKGDTALRALAGRLADHLSAHPERSLAAVCHTLAVGRAHHSHRLAIPVTTSDEARAALSAFATGTTPAGLHTGQSGSQRPRLAFLFTGQGSQYVGMGHQLYASAPAFRAAFDQCADLLQAAEGWDLRALVFGAAPDPASPAAIDDTRYTQPALFALEYALAAQWQAWGVQPQALLGHSVGEYVAACVAGVFSLEDGLKLISARARLMSALPAGGAMAAIFAQYEQVAQQIEPYADQVSIAAINGPTETVISGAQAVVAALLEQFEAAGIKSRPLVVSHAFHSPLMEPMLDDFERVAATIRFQPPRLPLISNLSGQRADPSAITTPRYWREHVRAAVQFAKGVATLDRLGYNVFVEIGPKPALLGMARRCLPDAPHQWLPSLRAGEDEWSQLLASLGAWYAHGGAIDWPALEAGAPRRRMSLPSYPWQHRRYWHQGDQLRPTAARTLEGPRLDDWLYELAWLPRGRPVATDGAEGNWLIFADRAGLGTRLAAALTQRGGQCQVVPAEQVLTRTALAQLLADAGNAWRAVIYLRALDSGTAETFDSDTLESDQRSFGDALHLVQALIATQATARLWLITKGSQPAAAPATPLALGQTPLWSLGQSLALEHPQLWGGLIDLAQDDDGLTALLDELQAPDGEDLIAVRAGQRLCARLVRATPDRNGPAFRFAEQGMYLVTHGLRQPELLHWLVGQGARHLLLVGSSLPQDQGEHAQATIDSLTARGATVTYRDCDLADLPAVAQLFADIGNDDTPLRGIIHTAQPWEAASLETLSYATFAQQFRQDAISAWLLHQHSRSLPLDCFVVFSSIAAVWGAAGLAHYAAAQRFRDALAHHRRALGLPALSINWGLWAALTSQDGALARSGLAPLDPSAANAALGALLSSQATQRSVVAVDWAIFRAVYEARGHRPLLAEIAATEPVAPAVASAAASDLAQRLAQATPARRRDMLIAYLQREVARLMGMAPDEPVDPRRGLFDMGMDSLMSVDLKRRLEAGLGARLSSTLTFDYPTIEALSEYILQDVLADARPLARPDTMLVSSLALLEGIEELSDDQLAAIVDHELAVLLQ